MNVSGFSFWHLIYKRMLAEHGEGYQSQFIDAEKELRAIEFARTISKERIGTR